MDTYTDSFGVERCDNCAEPVAECACCCVECGDHVAECACDEGPAYPAVMED
jgi:hypothetical protein